MPPAPTAPPAPSESSPILLVATGGTIASRPSADGSVTTALVGADLLATITDFDVGEVDVVDLAYAPSWNVEPELRAQIAATCRDALDHGRAAGVVVTHGTDTVEESAWLTELLAGASTVNGPIVFTAAMRHAAQLSADGPANLRDAIVVARDPASRDRGVLLCVNGDLHHARWVTKTDAHALDTFRSPASGPIGRIDAGRVTYTLTSPPPPPPPAPDGAIEPNVAIVPSYGGIEADVVDFFVDRGAQGLVLEGSGAGNVNQALVPGVRRALAADIPVVITTRCLAGAVMPVYGGEGGGARLAKLGVISGGDLGALKARLALTVALGRDPGIDAVRSWFAELVAARTPARSSPSSL